MSGKRYLLDTNAIIALLQGNQEVIQLLQDSEWIGISIISQLEFLSFSGLTESDHQLFAQLLQQLEVVGLSPDHISLLQLVVELRQKYRLPLPDAIITASAIQSNASLVTADQQLQKLQNIAITRFSP
jgi:tRNA(fMet)-specific endonuclease VapC